MEIELPRETKLYKISPWFARRKGLPIFFVAKPLCQTKKAVFLYGHGTTETTRMGVCMCCGRTLSHPVSVELGIGPECGQHYWDWSLVGGYNKENLERLRDAVKEIQVDTWIPKQAVSEILDTKESVKVPPNHQMLDQKSSLQKVKKKAVQIKDRDNHKRPFIKVTFPFNHDDLGRIKTLPGRRYHDERASGGGCYWTCPLSVDAVENLKAWEFQIDENLEKFFTEAIISIDTQPEVEVPGLQKELYPFQKKGVSFIEARKGRALIGDEMGLGKTAQALAWLQLHKDKRPVIIVVPASLKLNWAKEIQIWMGTEPNVQILYGTDPYEITGNIVIINYDILGAWLDKLRTLKAKVLITDECHYYKNSKAKRTKSVKALGEKTPHILALSGTPIVNRPVEAFNALKLIDPTVVPDFWTFVHKYCNARHNGWGWDFSGSSNTEELHQKLTTTIMIRRKKDEVLSELPPKTRSFVPMELDNLGEYHEAENDFIRWTHSNFGEDAAKKASNAEALAKIETLKQLCVRGKMKQVINWIDDFLSIGGKLVVFATHRAIVNKLMEKFDDIAVKVDGSMSGQDREVAVEKFQTNDNIRLFVGNIKAAGVGITLTAASSVAFVELGWSPGEHDQAEDRIHRIGQNAESIQIYYLLAGGGTIEEKIVNLIDKKRKILDQILDGKKTESDSLLSELIHEYGRERRRK